MASNEDDAAHLLVYRAIALREQGYPDGAHEAFKEALKSRSRAPEIRHFGLSERARNYLAQGKKAQARKDLERVLAEDSDYEVVRERLEELPNGTRAMLAALTRFRYSIWDSTMRAFAPSLAPLAHGRMRARAPAAG